MQIFGLSKDKVSESTFVNRIGGSLNWVNIILWISFLNLIQKVRYNFEYYAVFILERYVEFKLIWRYVIKLSWQNWTRMARASNSR